MEAAFTDALKRDIMDRGAIAASNKTISVSEVNNQLLAVRTAARIDVAKLPQGEFNATEHFEDIINDLKTTHKNRTPFEVIRKALAVLGYASMTAEKSNKVNGKTNHFKSMRLCPMV